MTDTSDPFGRRRFLGASLDVYEPRMLEAVEIAGGKTAQILGYRRMLDDKDVHAVLDRRSRSLAQDDDARCHRRRRVRTFRAVP